MTLEQQMKVWLEQQMKVWEQNANDPFGKLLKEIIKETNKWFTIELDDCNIYQSPISNYITSYSLDGVSSRKYIAHNVKTILEDWDILANDLKVKKLVRRLEKL